VPFPSTHSALAANARTASSMTASVSLAWSAVATGLPGRPVELHEEPAVEVPPIPGCACHVGIFGAKSSAAEGGTDGPRSAAAVVFSRRPGPGRAEWGPSGEAGHLRTGPIAIDRRGGPVANVDVKEARRQQGASIHPIFRTPSGAGEERVAVDNFGGSSQCAAGSFAPPTRSSREPIMPAKFRFRIRLTSDRAEARRV